MPKKNFFLVCLILILSSLFCFSSLPFLEATPPEIYSVAPIKGCTASSTQITINGAGFQPTPKVSLFGGGISIIGKCDTPYSANDIYIQDSYAYVADGLSGLQAIDISNPANPSLIDGYYIQGGAFNASDVYALGTYAYMAYGSKGLQVINISNPANLSFAYSRDTPGTAYGVYVQGSYAFIADGSEGLQVINISNPPNTSIVGSYNTTGTAMDVYVQGSYAYVADGLSGLQVINISNPAKLSLAGKFATPGSANGIYVRGSYAYIADGAKGLIILDISNPAHPSKLGVYDTSGSASKVHVQGSYAYVADGLSGLQIIDISDPLHPSLAYSCDTPGSASGVYLQGEYAFLADKSTGIQVIEILKNLTSVIFMDSGTIKATIPAGLNIDTYSIYITNPDSGQTILNNAFTITGIEIFLSGGLNIFGHPVKVIQGYTSYDLIEALGEDDYVANIQKYDPDSRSYEITAYDPNGAICGNKFNILGGEGYVVNMKNAKQVSFAGIITDPGISCKTGFNIISIPYIPGGYTSYNLLSYLGFSDEIASITRFNSEMGIYETTSYCFGRPSGTKFNIKNGEAYLIFMKAAKSKPAPN
ncbi:MAG: LVIVD repeat-containing protein [bacterium]